MKKGHSQKDTYPLNGAQGIVPTLELQAFGIVFTFCFRTCMELEIARPAMFRLVGGREALVARGSPDCDRDLRHGGLRRSKNNIPLQLKDAAQLLGNTDIHTP